MPIALDHLAGKTVLVVGLGESGLAMAEFCLRAGAVIRSCDTRAEPPQLAVLKQRCPDLVHQTGFSLEQLEQVDLLAWSPGISTVVPQSPELAAFLDCARGKNIPLCGEMELFANAMRLLDQCFAYRPKIIAITGTNGKTTTTLLTTHLCQAAGLNAVAAGNISPSALSVLTGALDSGVLPQVWVLELSSFQLATTANFYCDAATILNLTQDHFDWHGDFEKYKAAKQSIYKNARHVVTNRDDMNTADTTKRAVLGKRPTPEELEAQVSCTSFGLNEPNELGDFGIQWMGGIAWLAEAIPTSDELPGRRRQGPSPWRLNRLVPIQALPIVGLHNAANTLAALALCRAIGLAQGKILRALRSFKPEAHRCQLVRRLDAVEYIDDSKGTNVGATIAALQGLGRPIVLIAGGDGKGQDFAPLIAAIQNHARHVLLIGRDGPKIAALLQSTTVPFELCNNLESAVLRAAQVAQAEEAVLLSPACASLDMFRNYKHRAEVFVEQVNRLQSKPVEDLVLVDDGGVL